MKEDPLYRALPDSFEPPTPPAVPVRRRREYSYGLAFSMLLWWGTVLFTLWRFVPEFARVYAEVKLHLPWVTLIVVGASEIARAYAWGVAPVALGLTVWAGTWKGAAGTAGRLLLPLAYMATLAFLAFALFSPVGAGVRSPASGATGFV
jgi:hypothetical protein